MSGIFAPSYILPIVTGHEMARIDRVSIEQHGIPGLALMERAGTGVVQCLYQRWSASHLCGTAILCGKGNNGGDGFVIARHLFLDGLNPSVALLASPEDLRGDARTNYQRLIDLHVPVAVCVSDADVAGFIQTTRQAPLWIDAMLGTGTTGAPRGVVATAIERLNAITLPEQVVAIDVASGVDANTAAVKGQAVQAGWTITMGLPKVGHALPPGHDYGGTVTVLDIGFPKEETNTACREAEWLHAGCINHELPRRTLSAHKGTQGHLLVIAGSRGMTGAALLCAKASVEMGAGLVTALCPESQQPVYASGVWEMMTVPVPETDSGAFHENTAAWLAEHGSRFDAIVIGPGLGQHPSTQRFVQWVVEHCSQPMVIDGDGLNALTKETIQSRKHPWIATPHPGEMARLLQMTVANVQSNRWQSARHLVTDSGAVVLKGPRSVVADADTLTVNPTGTPAMASGGMGDTLTGMIGALLARGMSPGQAGRCGVFLHGLAAEHVAETRGAETVPASRVIDAIAAAVHNVRSAAQLGQGSPETTQTQNAQNAGSQAVLRLV